MSGAKALCAWGDGPDVLITVDRENVSGFPWTKYAEDSASGKQSEGSFGLTIDEALELASQIVQAAVKATRLDAGYAVVGTPSLSEALVEALCESLTMEEAKALGEQSTKGITPEMAVLLKKRFAEIRKRLG